MGPKKTGKTGLRARAKDGAAAQKGNLAGNTDNSLDIPRVGETARAEEINLAEEVARTEEARKRMKGEGYPRVQSGKECITLELLKHQLSVCQQNRESTTAALPDLFQERNRLRAAKNQNELRTWERKEGKKATRNYRSEEHNKLRDAQALLEDFLYYQNPTHRRLRYAALRADYPPARLEREGQRIPYLFVHGSDPRLRDVLDTFDAHGIGGPLYRQGLTDWGGNSIPERELGFRSKLVQPNELHLWTPVCRRKPVGFGVTDNNLIETTKLQLDEDALSEVCKRIRKSAIPGCEHLYHETNAQRNVDELGDQVDKDAIGDDIELADSSFAARTPTAIDCLKNIPEGKIAMEEFGQVRTREGVFIAALESSYVYPTSFDSLGPVSDKIHPNFTISAARDTIDGPNEESDKASEGPSAPGEPSGAFSAPESSPKRKAVHKTVFSTRKRSRKGAAKPQEPQVPITINYPYPAREFEDTSRERWLKLDPETDQDHAPISTAGRKEVYGRREWHVHMSLAPASPVDDASTVDDASPVDEHSNRNVVTYEGKGKARAVSGVEYRSS